MKWIFQRAREQCGDVRMHRRFPATRRTSIPLVWQLTYWTLASARGEEHLDYRFEDYNEDHHRVHVQTHGVLAEGQVAPWLRLKGEYVYDAIAGATPDGRPAPYQIHSYDASVDLSKPLGRQVPLSTFSDVRQGYTGEAAFHWGAHTLTPQFTYSGESDYISRGAALNYSLDLNQKNTTINTGLAATWDHVIPRESPYLADVTQKHSFDFLVGVNQLLSPKTTLTANFVWGSASGYLNDPYKGVVFGNYPQYSTDPALLGGLVSERRPRHRIKQIGYVALTQFITPLNGSVEMSYRGYHDSYGVLAHTLGVRWYQKIGHWLILSPLVRFYHQSAADFYSVQPSGDAFDAATWPKYFSADHRLSALETLTYGVGATVILGGHYTIDLGYKRYEMYGTDGRTAASAYPSANVFTIGGRLSF